MSLYESWIDRAMRQAQERGDFDNLPGAGKPLPDRGELNDDDWWLKSWMQREDMSAAMPTTLRLRKEVEDVKKVVADQRSESAVREYLADLNERILSARRGPVDGPPLTIGPVDVDELIAFWRERNQRAA